MKPIPKDKLDESYDAVLREVSNQIYQHMKENPQDALKIISFIASYLGLKMNIEFGSEETNQ